ncbi:hypothetical protein LG045_00725 [Limosilactobacillus gastricus]|uniref:Beta-1,6-galactofuranosyltransferase n=1 Tax=Limosilactobacillus gastricus DSM 16045 TaxID=1423749 RepID=A0A0R1V4R2_9LACO|nr:hypothetical protein [Limosilactobacillus gastricus]KRM00606.1 hypothetical protein FC60_GL001173 [Limosilactobacillus gastricus DSM 16045]QGF39769.1 hypothetical protein LG045_00725 [Limosilactobacillus gastricus]
MNYWVTEPNASLESGYPYWNEGASGKARFDVANGIKEVLDANKLYTYVYNWPEEPEDYFGRRFDGLLGGAKRDDIFFIQWPLSYTSDEYVQHLYDRIKGLGGRIVTVIHDLDSWRHPINFNEQRLQNVLANLNQSDGIIVHSKPMQERLEQDFRAHGLEHQPYFVILDLFGFQTVRNQYDWQHPFNREIDYAGNLVKAQFIKALSTDLKFNIYGQTDAADLSDQQRQNIKFQGSYDHEAIPQVLTGSFGLVWSSDSYPGVTGLTGEYERYNAPHKASMYLAADEPLIVARQAAIAPFVEKHGIGLVVDDLSQLKEAIDQLSEAEYHEMAERTHRIGNLIRQNFPIKRAVIEMIAKLEWN